jgi:hypothetical protein
MEPNVGSSPVGGYSSEVRRLYREYKMLFAELMSDELNGEQIARMAMEEALKATKSAGSF